MILKKRKVKQEAKNNIIGQVFHFLPSSYINYYVEKLELSVFESIIIRNKRNLMQTNL